MSDEKFDKKVRKLINENLRHNPEERPGEAWIHMHTRDTSKDPFWGAPDEDIEYVPPDEDQSGEGE